MNKYRIEIKWAIIMVITTLLWMVLEKLLGFHDARIEQHVWFTNLIDIPIITIFVLAMLEKRNKFYEGTLTYLQGFKTGVIITILVTLVSPATQYVTSTFITPDFFANMKEHTVRKGMMTAEEAGNYFTLQNYIIQVLLFTPILGIVFSAIIAIFTRKK